MKFNRSVLSLLFVSVLGFLAFVPKGEDPLDKLVNALQKWTDSIPQEKVYLHMDKPYYALGDTIWFKAYVTTGSRHQLSAISNALYVDLINEKDSVVKALKLPVTAGTSMGDFTVGDELKAGNYRIRAYTQWMRNVGEDYFFDRPIIISNPFETNALAEEDKSAKTNNDKRKGLSAGNLNNTVNADVQFFPESGSLIYGVNSKLGFKAVGTNGNGLMVKGEVLDEDQKHITDFASTHAGMGNFLLRPEAGKTYTAKITFADGTQKIVSLPKPLVSGYVLSVFQSEKDSILVRVSVTEQMVANLKTPLMVNFIAHAGGETISASLFKINRVATSFWLDKKLFPSGIAQFTLFSAAGAPLNERIAFIKRNDHLSLTVKTEKKIYKSKENVDLYLESLDQNGRPTAGSFSIAVVDESKVPLEEDQESTIFSNLLLTSDLRGYVEKPNYYFASDNEEVDNALDNLMLTQGYSRFSWKEITGTVVTPAFKAEDLGIYISGRVVSLSNRPSVNATVTLMSLRGGLVKGTSTDEAGRFKFDGIFLADDVKFAIQARTEKNSNKVEVILDSVPRFLSTKKRNAGGLNVDLYKSMQAYNENSKKQDDLLEQMGGMNRVNRLKEVNINARVYQKNLPKQRNYNANGPGQYDQIIKAEELQACPTLAGCLIGRIRGVIFKKIKLSASAPPVTMPYNSRASSSTSEEILAGAMMVVLDGMPYAPVERSADVYGSIFDYNDPSPDQIASIEVLRSVNYTNIYGPDAANGVILINTKTGGNHGAAYNPSITNISPKSFYRAKEFYTPMYDNPGSNNDLPDLRSTIYWNAGVKTDINGKTSVSIFNADGPGAYKVIVEGINANGELGRQVFRYSVTN
ncbi:hypothetical protein ACVWYN_001907 [Pedobacter sp. UYP24]